MGVEEILLVMRQTPFSEDGPTARYDACHTIGGQRHITQQHTRMDGEVIDALLSLFDQGIAHDLPGQVLGFSIDLLQCLVDGYRADRHGGVA